MLCEDALLAFLVFFWCIVEELADSESRAMINIPDEHGQFGTGIRRRAPGRAHVFRGVGCAVS